MRKALVRKQLVLLGRKIRELRRHKGLSQEELAARAEIHPTYLSGIECGKRNTSLAAFFSIARALNVKPAELVSEVLRDSPPAPPSSKRG